MGLLHMTQTDAALVTIADTAQEKRPAGRPSTITQDKFDEICLKLGEGISLRRICEEDGMPKTDTFMRWAQSNDLLWGQYTKARETAADRIFDELMDISDDGTNDWMIREDPKNPGYAHNGESVARSRLRIDTRKWYLSKLMPKRFGDRQYNELTGKDGESLQSLPPVLNITLTKQNSD